MGIFYAKILLFNIPISVKESAVIKTNCGHFKRDPAGLWHYDGSGAGFDTQAAEDAIKYKPPKEAAWFWWSGTPAPIVKGDTAQSLRSRWMQWRLAYLNDDKQRFLTGCIRGFATSEHPPAATSSAPS